MADAVAAVDAAVAVATEEEDDLLCKSSVIFGPGRVILLRSDIASQ